MAFKLEIILIILYIVQRFSKNVEYVENFRKRRTPVIKIRMEVASSRPDYLPTMSTVHMSFVRVNHTSKLKQFQEWTAR